MTAISPGVVLAAYLVVTGVILTVGVGRVSAGDLILHAGLLALAVAWRRLPAGIRRWAPLLALPVLYAELPAIIAAAGHQGTYDAIVLGWERRLAGSNPAAEWAARWPVPLASEAVHAAYLAYYPIVVSVPLVLHLARRERDFTVSVGVLLLTFTSCYLAYVVFPVEGPRYRGVSPAPDGPVRAAALWLLERGSSRGTAFPSSHVAATVTQCVLAARFFGWRGALLVVPAAGLAVGAVYGGFHYLVDVVAGAGLGAAVAAGALWFVRWSGQANATAPT